MKSLDFPCELPRLMEPIMKKNLEKKNCITDSDNIIVQAEIFEISTPYINFNHQISKKDPQNLVI